MISVLTIGSFYWSSHPVPNLSINRETGYSNVLTPPMNDLIAKAATCCTWPSLLTSWQGMELSTSQGAPLPPLSKRLLPLQWRVSPEAPLCSPSKRLSTVQDWWRRLLSTLPFTLGVSRESFLPTIKLSLCKEQICIQSATWNFSQPSLTIVVLTF